MGEEFDSISNAYDLCARAEAANNLRRYELAQEIASQALAIDPELAAAYGSISRACLGSQNYVDGEIEARRGLEIEPSNPWLLHLLARNLVELGKFAEAEKVALQLLEVSPDDATSHACLGIVYSESGRDQESLEHFRKSLSLEPSDRTHFQIGMALVRLKRFAAAEHHFRERLKVDPNDAASLNNLGVCLDGRGNKRDAALAFKAAAMVDPTMNVAKSNAKAAINEFTWGGVGAMALAYMALKVSLLTGGANNILMAVAIGVGILVVYMAVREYKRRDLESCDPQILEFYRAVCRDKEIR